MTGAPRSDEALRLRALEHLGEFGDALAREALQAGVLEVVPDVLAWEGSHGEVRGHRAVLFVPLDVWLAANASHATRDALTAAIAAAMAEREHESLVDLRLERGTVDRRMMRSTTPYRDPA